MLRGVQAASVALCYGNNNGGACAAGSVHPVAPNVAQSSPRLFSCPARLSNKPSLPSPSIHSLAFCVSLTRASLSACVSLIFFPLHLLPLSVPIPMPPVYFSSSLSSQFHPFFCPTKAAIHPWHLGANKTSSENAKPAQKCHRSRDFCLKNRSRSPRQSYFVFLVH